MILENYYIPRINDKHLKEKGFTYNSLDDSYSIFIPLDKYKDKIVLRGKITIHVDTRKVDIDVYTNDFNLYFPYYNRTNKIYDNYMDKINKKILSEFSYYGIKHKKSKYKKYKKKG